MGFNPCQLIFSLKDPQIPSPYLEKFREVAGRSGKPDEVDSCDLLSYYQSREARSEYFLVHREDFLSEIQDGPNKKVAFSYERFYGHLLLAAAERPRARDMLKENGEGDLKKWAERNYQTLWNDIPPHQRSVALSNALRDLCRDFPYRGSLTTCEGEECTKSQRRVIGFMGVSLDSEWAVGLYVAHPFNGYRRVKVHDDGSFTIAEVDLKGSSTLRRIGKDGKELGWIHADLSSLFRTDGNPFGVPQYLYMEHIDPATKGSGRKLWDMATVPLTVNMPPEQWVIAKQSDDLVLLPFIEVSMGKQDKK